MAHFTPEPWEVNTLAGKPNREVFAGDALICDCGVGGLPPESIEANASLIAAAPEMFEAMAEFVHRCEIGEVRSVKTYTKFKEILAKVTQ